MTLDLGKLSPQLRQMGQRVLERRGRLAARQAQARRTLAEWAGRWEELRDLVEEGEHTVRLASPREPLDAAVSSPPLPADHRVVATDGSQIEPDRHGPAEYFLINIGWAVLRYGSSPEAELASEPRLAYELEDMFIMDATQRRRVPVHGGHLSALRAVEELRSAVDLAEARGDGLPCVVLQDGTLLLWVLESRPEDFLREAFLRPYIVEMERCRLLKRPLASYISRPRSTEVSALLRAATCQGELARCASCPAEGDGHCGLEALHDRTLFEHLQVGQRSAIFATATPPSVQAFYEGHRIHFFFVNVGAELARVEVPEWVVDEPAMLELVHAVVVDQCRLGQGYPATLTRAHEQAIVRGADREMVRVLLEARFAQHGLQASFSEKEAAKRLRAV